MINFYNWINVLSTRLNMNMVGENKDLKHYQKFRYEVF